MKYTIVFFIPSFLYENIKIFVLLENSEYNEYKYAFS